MNANPIQSHGLGHSETRSPQVLLPMLLLLLLVAGCGQGDSPRPSGKDSASQSVPLPAVKKLTPEAARMELAKLNKDYSPAEFIRSAINDDKLAVELYLAAGMDVNVKNDEGMTALLGAALKGRKDVVGLLLAKGADHNLKLGQATALMLACEQGHREVALRLVEQPGEARGYNSQTGSNPLIWAAKHGWTDVVAQLLKKGDFAWITLEDAQNKSPLDYAKEGGHTEVVTLLEQARNRLKEQSPSSPAARPQAASSIQGGITATGVPTAAFARMMDERWMEAERIAFSLRATELTDDNLNSFRSSFVGKDIEGFRRRGCSDFQIAQLVLVVHEIIGQAAQAAVAFGDREPTESDKHKMKLYTTLYSESWMAFETPYLDSLKRGEALVDFRFKNRHGQDTVTALMLAAAKGRVDLAKALLDKGASIDLKDEGGRTALHYAAGHKQKEVEQLLLSKGAAPVRTTAPSGSPSVDTKPNEGRSQTTMSNTPAAGQPRRRPRTMAEARDAMSTEDEINAYDTVFKASIQKRYSELRNQAGSFLEAKGKVSLSFRLCADGRITDMTAISEAASAAHEKLCQKAVLDGAPYRAWSDTMRQKVGEDYRNVQFNFSFDPE